MIRHFLKLITDQLDETFYSVISQNKQKQRLYFMQEQ